MSEREVLADELRALSAEAQELSKKVSATFKRGEKLSKADVMPAEFTGIVRNYRYAAGKKGEMPTHRFELECGQGLWMFVSCPSNFFDEFMKNMDMGDKLVAKALNGGVVTVKRNPSVNALVPVKYLGDTLIMDANGKLLWKGARVRNGSIIGIVEEADKDSGLLRLSGVDGYEYDGEGTGFAAYNYDCLRID
jgi:hypothetical protein